MCVVTKDRAEGMRRCLDGIGAQRDVRAEVVVVIDATSTEPVADVCREAGQRMAFPVRVEVIEGSVAQRRNHAVRLATAPLVAWTDSDCVPRPGWLRGGIDAFSADVAVVQGRTVPEDVDAGWWPATQDIPAFTGIYETCNVFYRRDALLAAGGFDESFRWFCEDTAAGLAVRRAGWDATFSPDAVVEHETLPGGPRWWLRRSRHYDQWNVLARRYPEVRAQLFWNRWFLRQRDAYVVAAAIGVGAGLVWRPALLATLPWLAYRRPSAMNREQVGRAAALMAFDAACCAALWRGSLRNRSIVL